MPICAGCSAGGCTCAVDGVTITGAGIPGDPFVAGCGCEVDGTTITGAGTLGDPFVAAGGGGGGPFIIVAAYNSSPARQAIANYVCDGTADQVEINQAVADLNVLGSRWGGTVYLLEGEFSTSAPIALNYSVNLQGAGQDVTSILFDENGDAGPRTDPANPYGDDYVIIELGTGVFVSDLFVNQFDNSGTGFRGGIRVDGSSSLVNRVHVQLDSDPGIQPIQNSAIRLGAGFCAITNSLIEAYDGTAIDGGSDQEHMRIENNIIGGSIGFDGNGTDYLYISGNHFFGGAEIGATIYDYSGFPEGYGNGINIWAGPDDPTIIIGNHIEGFARSGIFIDQAEDVSIINNVILECSQAASNTYSGIWIREDCYAVNVQGNMVRGPGDHKYGIEVGASFNTLVANNDLLDSGITGSFFDGGTDTVTLGGNRIA